MNLNVQVAEALPRLAGWRRQIHSLPELAFNEHRTAGFVADKMAQAGIEVFTGIGGTGVVGRLRSGNGTRAIGLRADLDALPMQEANRFKHRSVHDGVFHGCGHDGHTVMLLAAALQIARQPRIDGTVYFIFQPAEEGMGGAEAMIGDGLFDDYGMDYVFGMHNWPGLPVGTFSIQGGPMMAALEKFDIEIRGKGGHGAMPERCVDPVLIAAQVIQAMQSVVSRDIAPAESAVISITRVNAGEAYNVIPDAVRLGGAIRYLTKEVGRKIRDRMQKIVTATGEAGGGEASLKFDPLAYPPLINDAAATRLAAAAAASVVGIGNVGSEGLPVMGSEDFAHMLEQCPGCFIFIGNGTDSCGGCSIHHPEYDFNDDIIPIGASYWISLAESYLQKQEA